MHRLFKLLTFLLCLAPLTYSVYQVWLLQSGGAHQLGADPGKALVLFQGEWTIRLLIATLFVSPLRKLTGWSFFLRIRRMLGLFTFFYASLHLTSYFAFLLEFDPGNLADDLLKRPYISVGFIAWLLLIPLAVTSTNRMRGRLGKRWVQLHQLVYPAAILAIMHLFWLSKSSYLQAFTYGIILLLLLSIRFLPSKTRLPWQRAKAPC